MGQLDQTVQVTTRQRISAALKQAEAEDANGVRAQTLRLIKCAMTDRDVTARGRGDCAGCPEEAIQTLLETMAEQRERSIKQYDEAGRIVDAERERDELDVINEFLPKALAGEALEKAVASVVSELQARKLKDVGRCMSALRARFPGQIECGTASKAVRAAIG
ncbi:MAG: GatB/YqeY domain-containing protein [Pseudomonadota bacterium]